MKTPVKLKMGYAGYYPRSLAGAKMAYSVHIDRYDGNVFERVFERSEALTEYPEDQWSSRTALLEAITRGLVWIAEKDDIIVDTLNVVATESWAFNFGKDTQWKNCSKHVKVLLEKAKALLEQIDAGHIEVGHFDMEESDYIEESWSKACQLACPPSPPSRHGGTPRPRIYLSPELVDVYLAGSKRTSRQQRE